MTVSNYTPLSVTPGAGAVLAPIAIPSPFYNDSDIKVYFVDSRPDAVNTETLLIKDTNYTMTKTALAGTKPRSYTGTVSVLAAIPASCSIAVMIDPVNAQASDLSAVPFSPMEYEREFDLSVMRDAALRELVKRSVRSSLSSTTALGIVFPVPAALRVIGWNAYGNLENFDVSQLVTLAGAATAAQGEKADTALQPDTFGNIEVIAAPPGGVKSTPDRKWAQIGISPKDFNAAAGTGGDDTAAFQAALNYCASNGLKFDGQGKWRVSYISLGSSNETFEIVGDCVLTLIDTSARVCGLEITRGNFVVSGKLTVFGQYKYNYEHAIWVHNDSQVQFVDLSKVVLVGAKGGLRVGDISHPASVTSEITLIAPRTFGVPKPLQVEGAQTYIAIVAPPCLSADGFGGDGAWNTQTFRAILNKGANLKVVGGEVIQTGSGAAANWLIEQQPCMQGADISWGRTTHIGVTIETGGPLCLVSNPLALSGTSTANDRPFVSFIGCEGYHSQDNAAFIDVAADFPGDIIWEKSTVWKNGAARTQPNILLRGNLAHAFVDDRGFGPGFLGPLVGTVGGIVRFSRRSIVQAVGMAPFTGSGGISVAGPNNLIFPTKVSEADLPRFANSYNAATGVFTVPVGGLRNLGFKVQTYIAGAVGGIIIRENGTEIARAPFISGVGQVSATINGAVAGNQYSFAVDIASGAGGLASGSAFLHRLDIEAHR